MNRKPSTSTYSIDAIDLQILKLVNPTMGMTSTWIASQVSLPVATIRSRLGRLRRDGLLSKVDDSLWRLTERARRHLNTKEPTQ